MLQAVALDVVVWQRRCSLTLFMHGLTLAPLLLNFGARFLLSVTPTDDTVERTSGQLAFYALSY